MSSSFLGLTCARGSVLRQPAGAGSYAAGCRRGGWPSWTGTSVYRGGHPCHHHRTGHCVRSRPPGAVRVSSSCPPPCRSPTWPRTAASGTRKHTLPVGQRSGLRLWVLGTCFRFVSYFCSCGSCLQAPWVSDFVCELPRQPGHESERVGP